jgi:nuclear RNA export factor
MSKELCTEFYTPLSRQNVMQTVVQIIGEHIPDVQVIDLSNNKIYSVDHMKPLVTKAAFLKTLNLANNDLVKITSLDRLQGLALEELILNRNPLCDHFNEQSTYIR